MDLNCIGKSQESKYKTNNQGSMSKPYRNIAGSDIYPDMFLFIWPGCIIPDLTSLG